MAAVLMNITGEGRFHFIEVWFAFMAASDPRNQRERTEEGLAKERVGKRDIWRQKGVKGW